MAVSPRHAYDVEGAAPMGSISGIRPRDLKLKKEGFNACSILEDGVRLLVIVSLNRQFVSTLISAHMIVGRSGFL
jgi:hypothetical protein